MPVSLGAATPTAAAQREGRGIALTSRALAGSARRGVPEATIASVSRPHGWAIRAGVVVVLVEAGWLLFELPAAALASDIGAVVLASIAACCCLVVARRRPQGVYRFWRLLALTMALAAAGRAVWTVSRLAGDGRLPNNLLVGGIFTAGIVSGTAALLSCVTAPPTAVGRLRVLLDGVIVGLALVPIGWLIAFREVAAAPMADPVRTLGLLYPMLDLMQLTILVAVSGPLRPVWRPLTAIGCALALRVIADTVYISLVARDSYLPGHPIDLCWPVSYLLMALATGDRAAPAMDSARDGIEDRPVLPWWRLALPYLPVGGAIVAMVLARHLDGHVAPPVFLSGMALLAALAIRQGLAAYETTELAHRLRRLAYTDQLTGLPNRLRFTRRLRRALRGRLPVAVLLLDLDGFKQVNDRFGHASGDSLLVNVADRMRAVVGDRAMISRIGGDEFAVLLGPDRGEPPDRLAERLLAALRPGPLERTGTLHSSASIGIAEYGPQHTGHTDLLRDADIAMYAAKAAGKSAYRICTPALREAAVSRAELIADLRRAVDEGGQLRLEFQPIVELATGAVRGAEALVRWRHPRLGTLPPGRFLPLAEETGLIVAVDRWVIRAACRAAADWQDVAPDATVSVNVAAVHLRRADLAATVANATVEAGLDPHALTVELTESALIEDTETVLDRLRDLRALGVRIAIDDFGTGYSSLNYLHRIPATELKIDQSFVRRLDAGRMANPAAPGTHQSPTAGCGGGPAVPSADGRAYATVEMVRRLATAFGLGVVAEGVETDAQHAAVAAIGCTRGQGYRYGRPGTVADLRRAMRTGHADGA
ncbi:putative bifunctional diguanylate cyclase/phosphodiesterase [Plantactinospora sp. GCM10030261]|uniref:putative bifunctional diguanylate cyclase/phosphodiesterase n=1 Tax=Plantactinospora sp. GCM10030261 TaxID=3273420 RepID=UPI003620838E